MILAVTEAISICLSENRQLAEALIAPSIGSNDCSNNTAMLVSVIGLFKI